MGEVQSTRLKAVWGEIRRRKVFKVALVYVLMAWGVMQVGELLFEALQLPEGAYTLLVILVLLGFPVAIVLAWAYEITPDGVRRDIVKELKMESMRHQASHCSCGERRKNHQHLAILPFRDMAPNQDIGYFCEGMAEEIQTALCKVPGLEIVARAHAVQFGGKKIDIDKIREKLRVDAVIEGSVRCSGENFRVSVQLVDIGSGTDIWCRSFELAADDEFEVQKKVAAEVAAHAAATYRPAGGSECENDQLDLGLKDVAASASPAYERELRH